MIAEALSRHRTLLLAIVVGVGLRLALVIAYPSLPLVGDENDYVRAAATLTQGSQDPWLTRQPPLYTAFCALVLTVLGLGEDSIRVVQCLLEGLTIGGVFLLARRVFDERSAVRAAWCYALYPDFITYSHLLWSETVFLDLLVWSLLALLVLKERGSVAAAAGVGLLWGVSSLIKPYGLYMLPLLLCGLVAWPGVVARARLVRVSVIAVAVSVLAIAPWSIYVSLIAKKPVLIATLASLNLETGVNFQPAPQYDFSTESGTTGKTIRNAPEHREGGVVAFIVSHPALYVSRAFEKMGFLWSPNSYLLRHIYVHQKYGPPQQMAAPLRLGAVYATLLSTIALSLALVAGLFFSRVGVFHVLTGIYLFAYMGMITLTPSLSRHRLPLMLFAVVFAGAWLAGRVSVRDGQQNRVAAAGAAACLIALLVVWAVRLPPLLERVW